MLIFEALNVKTILMKSKGIFTLLMVMLMVLIVSITGGGSKQNQDTSYPQYINSFSQQQPQSVDPVKDKGVGPVTKVELGALNAQWVKEGETIYKQYCIACHNIDQKLIGPPQRGVLKRRTPEWVMNMILNPQNMVKDDPIAKKLFMDFNQIPMTNQNLTQDQARKILEYFRTTE
jgi:mono/diheme cytochrome c family protein